MHSIISHPPGHLPQPSLIFLFPITAAMSFNTAALYGCHQPSPSSYQARDKPLPPLPRASTMTQDAITQWHCDEQRMPGLRATDDNSPPLIFNRECSFIWDDANVQSDRAMAAIEQESIDRKRTMHERERRGRTPIDRKQATYDSVDRERRGRVSLDQPQEHPAFIDYERVRHATVDRKRQRCESVDRERVRRAIIDWRHDCERDMSIGRHGQYGSGSRTLPRPPVCAVSPKPPTTCPKSRPRRFESESVTVPRPPVCAVSFKPPTTGPQSRHPRRFSFDYTTDHDHSGAHQHTVYDLPPNAVPQIHMPTRRRTASLKAVRRLRFTKPAAPPLESPSCQS